MKFHLHNNQYSAYFRGMKLIRYLALSFGLVFAFSQCDNHEVKPSNPSVITGTGRFIYDGYQPFQNKPIECFYHIPNNVNPNTPVVILFHGASRNAEDMRDYLIDKANQKGFIVLSPEFSDQYFPGGDGYNLANIYVDGDNPSPSTLNPEEVWTFSVVDPLFKEFTAGIGNATSTYDMIGFSAGAQIVHRFVLFNPTANYNRIVAASSGWYTVPVNDIEFPYGLKISPQEGANLRSFFAKKMYVIVGEDDVDPSSAGLRHTPEADAQGFQRLQRAQHFYQESRAVAVAEAHPINWVYQTVPNTDHDGEAMTKFAADLLYN